MQVENNIFPKFKSYNDYLKEQKPKVNEQERSFNPKPLIGSALGVGAMVSAFHFLKKNNNNFIYKFTNSIGLKEKGSKTVFDVTELISTAAMANVGSVLLNSKGKTKEQKKNKWKEAAFQVMNMALPMLLTTTALRITEAIKPLNKVPIKIIASIIGMALGAFSATTITNALKKDNEQKRKYTIKDTIANFDDIVATVKLGFSEVEKYIPVSKILPFIYIYSGSRAGSFGDKEESQNN